MILIATKHEDSSLTPMIIIAWLKLMCNLNCQKHYLGLNLSRNVKESQVSIKIFSDNFLHKNCYLNMISNIIKLNPVVIQFNSFFKTEIVINNKIVRQIIKAKVQFHNNFLISMRKGNNWPNCSKWCSNVVSLAGSIYYQFTTNCIMWVNQNQQLHTWHKYNNSMR